jgi:hypothetical protein
MKARAIIRLVKLMFVPCKPIRLSLMLVGKCQVVRLKDASLGLTNKHYIKLERRARDKQPSLLRTLINYGRKDLVALQNDTEVLRIRSVSKMTLCTMSLGKLTLRLMTIGILLLRLMKFRIRQSVKM